MKKILVILVIALMISVLGTAAAVDWPFLGKPFVDFSFTDTDGNEFSLSEALKDHEAVFINLWTSWCGPCRREFPYINLAYKEFGDKIAFVGLTVEPEDTMEKVAWVKTTQGMEYPVGQEEGTGILEHIGGRQGNPTTIIVDRFGNAVFMQEYAFRNGPELFRLLKLFTGDEYTKFYIGWLQLNGIGDTDFDDATKFTRVGMSVNIGDIFAAELLIRDEGTRTQHLASYKERKINESRFDGESRPLIDKVHRAMWLYSCGDEMNLLPFISRYGQDLNNEFWHVFVVLKELLPVGTDDYIQASGLLQNAESLIRRSKEMPKTADGPSLWDTID